MSEPVHSFTQRAYLWMLASPVLYPSNKKLRPDEETSDLSALAKNFFDCQNLPSPWHRCGKPLRAVARLVCGIGTIPILAPAGFVYYLCKGFGRSLEVARQAIAEGVRNRREVEDLAQHDELERKYFDTSIADLWMTIYTLSSLLSISRLRTLYIVASRLHMMPHMVVVVAIEALAGTSRLGLCGRLFIAEDNPTTDSAQTIKRTAIHLFARVALICLVFRNFPSVIVTLLVLEPYFLVKIILKTLSFLYHYATAPQKVIPYLFFSSPSHEKKGVELVRSIRFKNDFGIVADGTNGLLTDEFVHSLWNEQKDAVSEILKTVGAQLPMENPPESEEVRSLIDEAIAQTQDREKQERLLPLKKQYDVFCQRILRLHEIESECGRIEKTCAPPSHEKDWREFLKKQKIPDQIEISNEECREIHAKLKGKESPLKIFGFDAKPNEQELKKRYGELSLVIHPDKNPGHKETATLLFQCIRKAYEILKDSDSTDLTD